MMIRLSFAGSLRDSAAEVGPVPEKGKENMLASDVEIDGDTYVSSLEDPPTPIPIMRPGMSGRREAVSCQVSLSRCDSDVDVGVPGPSGERNAVISGRSSADVAVVVSDTRPEVDVANVRSRDSWPGKPRTKRKVIESSSEAEYVGEFTGSPRNLRPRGVKTFSKCVRPLKKRIKSSSTRKSSDTTDEQPSDGRQEGHSQKSLPDDHGTLAEKKGKMVGRKPFLNKEKVCNRLVKEFEEVPQDFDELRDRSTPSLGAMAQRWIDEIDFIKSKCKTMQGPLMRRITERTVALTNLVQLLAERVQDNGDISYLKKQNIEMSSRVNIYEKEVTSLKNEVRELTDLISELQHKALAAVEEEKAEASRLYLLRARQDRATSPMPQIMESPPCRTYRVILNNFMFLQKHNLYRILRRFFLWQNCVRSLVFELLKEVVNI